MSLMELRRKNSYKTSGMAPSSSEGGRRRREDNLVQIRTNRDHVLAKRRNRPPSTQPTASETPSNLLESLPNMVERVWSSDPALQLEAAIQFRKLLATDPYPPIEEVINSGVLPRFADFLSKHELPQIQYEAAWIMANISFGTSDNIQVAVENGVIPKLVQLLSSPNIDIREQAVWALGNIAGDSPHFRDLVLIHGGLLHVLSQINETSTISMIRNATWVLSNFFRGKPPAQFEQLMPALPVLKQLILSNDVEVLKDVCWAFCYFSAGSNDNIKALHDTGICSSLVEILCRHSSSASSAIIMPILTMIGNIYSNDISLYKEIIDNQFLSCLARLLDVDHKPKIKKEACCMISNIIESNKDNIQAVIDANIIQPLLHFLTYAEYDIKRNAAWAITNALCHGCSDQIRALASQGCIVPLCNLLSISDTRCVLACLNGLESILKVGEADKKSSGSTGINVYAFYMYQNGCSEKIEALVEHGNNDICKKAIIMMETYWDDLEED